MAGIIPTTGSAHEDQGALSRGGQHPSGSGRADGSAFGTPRSGATPRLTGFDATVPENGYRWWYIDALSHDGRYGLTIIAFVGSVFSPYYAWARRRGRGNPNHYCALNVALYGKSGHHWAMTERGARATERSATQFIIGPSDIKIDDRCMTIRIRERTTPFLTKLIGEVTLTASTLTDHEVALDPENTHYWRPVAPLAHMDVRFDHPRIAWSGHAYHDMNWGARPLESSFESWFWSRATSSAGAHIIYDKTLIDGTRSGFAIDIDRDGIVRDRPMPPETELGTTFWRMKRPARLANPPDQIILFEDSPFYSRSLIETRIGNERIRGFHESLSLKRFKAPWMQMMLPFRMPRWNQR